MYELHLPGGGLINVAGSEGFKGFGDLSLFPS